LKQKAELSELLKPTKLLLPLAISLLVMAYLFYNNVKHNPFANVSFSAHMLNYFLLAILMIFIRDFAYMIRIRVLTNNEIEWRKCFQVIMLWEFCSAIVPQILGGGFAFAVIVSGSNMVLTGSAATGSWTIKSIIRGI
jgi:hypothetical protein